MAGAEAGQGAPRVIRPQPGPQTAFLGSPADIAIYGGAAGGGKTWALLMEPLRHVGVPGFGAVFFRRTLVQVRNEGGLWDESEKLYPLLGAKPRIAPDLTWTFPARTAVSFAHLEHEKNVLDWQGSQIPLICFDELTHFSSKQFWYLLSRNRSMCGVRPYVRATCNPDADSWVAEFISWWIDPDTGLAIPERAGVLRWFVRVGDAIIWADQPDELSDYRAPNEFGVMVPIQPKSVTFIPAKLSDNKALMAADPGYLATLMSLPTVERERLLGGNWKIRPAAGLYFRREWCTIIDAVPAGTKWLRGWDLASTQKTEQNDPDWTAGTKIGKTPGGRYIVADHRRDRVSPAGVERMLKNTATDDGKDTEISLPQDPGQAGKSQVSALIKLLEGFIARATPESGDKLTRFGAFSAQAEAGNVDVLRAPWNEIWFSQLEGFPEAAHDDDADSTSRAFNALIDPMAGAGLMELYRRLSEDSAKPKEAAKRAAENDVTLYAPSGTGTVYLTDGRKLLVEGDGSVVVAPADAIALRRSGFTDQPST